LKIVDQYIQAVGSKLPLKGRSDIKRELEGLIMEDIESRFGKDPAESDAMEALRAFGSPQSVALRYTENRSAISAGLTPLYLMLIKIVPGALALAFAVVTAVQAVSGNTGGAGPLDLVLSFFSNAFSSSLVAIGAISIAFVLASRFFPEASVDPDDEWDPVELKDVELDPDPESLAEHWIAIAGLSVTVILMNAYPQILSALESLLFSTGFAAGNHHLVNIERFRFFVLLFNPVWAAQAVRAVFAVSGKASPRLLALWGAAADLATAALHWAMVLDLSLYAEYTGIVGFRLIFSIVAVIETIELAVFAVRALIRKMECMGA